MELLHSDGGERLDKQPDFLDSFKLEPERDDQIRLSRTDSRLAEVRVTTSKGTEVVSAEPGSSSRRLLIELSVP